MAAHNTVKTIAMEWLDKGDRETSLFNKFISYWIAFNAFYSFRTSQTSDKNALDKLKKDPHIAGIYASLITANEEKFNALKNICPVDNVNKPGQSLSLVNHEDFTQTIDLLYLIRCNLFHGDKGESEIRDKEVIGASTPVLGVIARKMIENLL